MKILITNGHTVNGADRGSVAHNGVTEGQLNYELANKLKEKLVASYKVDVDVKQEELNKAREWSVKNRQGYDLALSLHHNAFNKVATGTEVLFKNDEALAKKLSAKIANTLNIKNRGAKKRDDLYILNIGFDALLEVCFIDNKNDFTTNYCVENIALAIVKVIGEHYKLELKEGDEVVTTAEILIDGKKYPVNRILKDGKNYVELRGFEQAGYKVGYKENEKLATFDK